MVFRAFLLSFVAAAGAIPVSAQSEPFKVHTVVIPRKERSSR